MSEYEYDKKKHEDYYWFKCKKVYYKPEHDKKYCDYDYDYDYDHKKKYDYDYDYDHEKKYDYDYGYEYDKKHHHKKYYFKCEPYKKYYY